MSNNIKLAIKTYLSAPRSDNERVVKSITRAIKTDIPHVIKTKVNHILYNDEDFTFQKKPFENRVYWYLSHESIITVDEHVSLDRVHIFVDVDNSPNIFYDYISVVKNHYDFFLCGYSGPAYNTSKVRKYMNNDSDNLRIRFYKSNITLKDAADVAIILDVHNILVNDPQATCFIISCDKIFETVAEELKIRFPQCDLNVGPDSENIRRDIDGCL